MIVGNPSELRIHNQRFHDKFRRENSLDNINREFKALNSSSINDTLRTRPTGKTNVTTIEHPDYNIPSVQKYNKRGKLY